MTSRRQLEGRWEPGKSELSSLDMWQGWQKRVTESIPFFARCPIFVSQTESEDLYCEQANKLSTIVDLPEGKTRDEEFGARVVSTNALGKVTRQWLDGVVEYDFLQRSIASQGLKLAEQSVLDVGAGYGRLAAILSPYVLEYTCVDAVTISSFLCEYYTMRFCPKVSVLTLLEFETVWPTLKPDIAINIHSWSECSLDQIERWITILSGMDTRYLFVVPHDDRYSCWSPPNTSFLNLLEVDYERVAEEILSMQKVPHTLWRKRTTG